MKDNNKKMNKLTDESENLDEFIEKLNYEERKDFFEELFWFLSEKDTKEKKEKIEKMKSAYLKTCKELKLQLEIENNSWA